MERAPRGFLKTVSVLPLLLAFPDFLQATEMRTSRAVRRSSTVSGRKAIRSSRRRPIFRRAAESSPSPQPVPAPAAPPHSHFEPSPPRAPHNLGVHGSYGYAQPNPPPRPEALRPGPSISGEFLSRIAVKHAVSVGRVKAVRHEKVSSFDPNDKGDAEVLVLDGAAPSAARAHNRDQGGKPEAGGRGLGPQK